MTKEEEREKLIGMMLETTTDEIGLKRHSQGLYEQAVVKDMRRMAEATMNDPAVVSDFVERGEDINAFFGDLLAEAVRQFGKSQGHPIAIDGPLQGNEWASSASGGSGQQTGGGVTFEVNVNSPGNQIISHQSYNKNKD